MSRATPPVYRLISSPEWAACRTTTSIPRSAIDERDGFVHLSGPDVFLDTATRYFRADQAPLALVIDPDRLPGVLRWEAVAERDDRLFPHLYGAQIPTDAVVAVIEIVYRAGNAIEGTRRPYPSAASDDEDPTTT